MTFTEVAAELSEVAEFAAGMKEAGLPDDFADVLAGVFSEIMDGHNAYLADGVQRALGRAPRDFSEYLRTAAATGVWRRD
jgi:hypothetical protein